MVESRDTTNPFEAPNATPEERDPRWAEEEIGSRRLASRGARLAGVCIDSALYVAVAVPGFLIAPLILSSGARSFADLGEAGGAFQEAFSAGLWVALMLLGMFSLAVYQWGLIVASGQSLGKRWLKTKIVKLDGTPVDFVSGVLLRSWALWAIGAIPLVGGLVTIVDWLMVFGADRRCLHDQIAGTIVIDVTPR